MKLIQKKRNVYSIVNVKKEKNGMEQKRAKEIFLIEVLLYSKSFLSLAEGSNFQERNDFLARQGILHNWFRNVLRRQL